MTEIMAYRRAAVQHGSSRRQLQPTVHFGDGRDDLTLTPIPGIDGMIINKRTHVESPRLLLASNADKYESKQDPGGWLVVYTTIAYAIGATKDVMMVYLSIVLGQDTLQWL
jgi:hypothetical protein